MKNLFIIFLILTALLFSACMREEGCLDAGATNFAPGADKDCDVTCCEYPKLNLRFFTDIDTDSFYTDAGNNRRFRVDDVRFFISDFQLVRADGAFVGVRDMITLEPSGEVVEDNYLLTKLNSFSYEIGNVSGYGDFVGVQFKVGLDAAANTAQADLMPDGHPLGIQEDTMYVSVSEGYNFQKIGLSIIADTDTTSQVFAVLGDDNLRTVSLIDTFSFLKSFNVEIQLNVNYLSLFDGIDFEADSEAVISEKIVANISGTFTIP